MEDGDAYYSEEQYEKIKKESEEEQEIIEMKIKGQLEIQRILWKEIVDNKKSLVMHPCYEESDEGRYRALDSKIIVNQNIIKQDE